MAKEKTLDDTDRKIQKYSGILVTEGIQFEVA